MRGKLAIGILLLIGLFFADFRLEKAEITIDEIDENGGARVQERISFLVTGDLSSSLYTSGLYNNNLAFWANATQLKDVRLHVDATTVDIQDFRLKPQPQRDCNAFARSCRGVLIIEYKALPQYNTKGERMAGTGLFFITREKPRTITYTINPRALLFTNTEAGDIIIDREVVLRILLPRNNLVTELNPLPEGATGQLPQRLNELVWTNTILIRFSLMFQVEEQLGKEVTDFFSEFIKSLERIVFGEHGIAAIVLVIILVGGYIYITKIQYKK